MIRLALIAALWASGVAADGINVADLPGLPEPYVCHRHDDLVAALLAMDPPRPLLARPSVLTADGRRLEFYGDQASMLFILTVATPITGSIRAASCTIIIGATDRLDPPPLTPDPTR